MKVLIWQTAFLGDVVLTTPLIKTLKKNFKDILIGFVGRPFIRDLFKDFNIELIPFSKGFIESFKIREKIKSYDIVISPHRSARTALILFFSGIKERIGFDKSEFPFLYTETVKHRWETHEVDRNLELLKPLGIREFVRETELKISEEDYEETLKKFNLEEKGYVVLSPFSNFRLKEWSIENWATLINKMSVPVVITGTREDLQKSKFLETLVKKRFINLTGKTSLRELMALLRGAKIVVANDSSPVHIANAFGVPAITIYTATSPVYGFYPLIGKYVKNPAPCSPCSPNPKRCKKGTEECLNIPTPEIVFSSIEDFL